MLTGHDFQFILKHIEYRRPGREEWKIRILHSDTRPYLQIFSDNGTDSTNGEPLAWVGRKWWLSPHMCVSEVVRTAYKALLTAEEHELCENFRWKGETIYSPHIDVDALADVADRIDTREDRRSKP